MEKAKKKYNDIMFEIAREHLTIGTKNSEGTDEWNLRDMVSEMQYTLDVYNDPSCIYWEEAHDDTQPSDKPWYREWIRAKGLMKRFIDKYKQMALTMECTVAHCSKFD